MHLVWQMPALEGIKLESFCKILCLAVVESRAFLGTLILFQLPLENGTLRGRRVALGVCLSTLVAAPGLKSTRVTCGSKQAVPGPAQAVESQGHVCREDSAVHTAQARRGRLQGMHQATFSRECTVRDSCMYLLVTSANALPGAHVHGATRLGQGYRQNTNLSL